MIAFTFYLFKVIICSGVLFLYYHLALRNKLFHQWNRFYLLAAIIISLIAPVMQVSIMHQGMEEPNKAILLLLVLQSANGYLKEITMDGHQPFYTDQWLMVVYLLVSAVFLLSVLLSLQKIISLIRSHTIQWIDKIKFINTNVQGTPFSFFHFIFWNENIDLQTETGKQIFQHELVHVKEKHTIDKLFMQIILVLFWCNPFFWLMRRELKLIHEFIADKKAVGQHGAAALAAMILNTSYPSQFNSVSSQFFQTSIKRRLSMLTKIQNPKINYFSRVMALSIIAITVLAFTLRTTNSREEVPEKNIQATASEFDAAFQQDQLSHADTIPKKTENNLVTENSKKTSDSLQPSPLFVLDGKEVPKAEARKIDPSSIESINVLKGKPATDKYGKKGMNGVVEMKLKKQKLNKDINSRQENKSITNETIKNNPSTTNFHGTLKPINNQGNDAFPKNNPVFSKVEIEAIKEKQL